MLAVLTRLPGHLLWRARMHVAAELAEGLPAGVDVHAYAVLHVLQDGRARSQQELAAAVAVSRTTLGTVAAQLVDQGLVGRVRNPADRRSWMLTLTSTGTATAARWSLHVHRSSRRLEVALDTAQQTELRDLLHTAADPLLDASVPATLRSSTGFLITRVHERAHRDFLEALRPLGLEPRHFAALVALSATGPVSQGELARHLHLSGARLVQIVDDLEERGAVSRGAAPGDRRTHLLHLEPRARRLLEQAHEAADRTVSATLAPLTATERERCASLLLSLLDED